MTNFFDHSQYDCYARTIFAGNTVKTIGLCIISLLMLTGCASHVHQLVPVNNEPFISGELVHDAGKNNRLIIGTQSQQFESVGFAVEKQTNFAELRKRLMTTNRKHWERIASGLDTNHATYLIDTDVVSKSSEKMTCHLIWGESNKPAGHCTNQSGNSISIRFG